MEKELIISGENLKEKLDNIDKQVYAFYGNKYGEAMEGVYVGQWYKGKEIAVSPTPWGEGDNSYRELERQTGRKGENLKKWHDLYKQYNDLNVFKYEYVKPKVEQAMLRWLEGQKKLYSPTEIPSLPEGKYQVIYADPPWKYGQDQHSKEEQETVLGTHYPSMETDDICKMPVEDLTGDNAVLFLWTTSPKLYEAKRVIDAWGFEYKTSMIWDKVKHNVGYYVSVRHEFLLICTKGSCLPDNPKLYDSVITEERTEHSKKPEVFYEIIEDIYKGKKVELFARQKRDGWEAMGNQL